MDKVKIKRVKRDKKKVTTKEKILAGLGVGGSLLGGLSSVSPQKEQKKILSENTAEESSVGTKIKGTLKNIFGAAFGTPQVKAGTTVVDTAGLTTTPDINNALKGTVSIDGQPAAIDVLPDGRIFNDQGQEITGQISSDAAQAIRDAFAGAPSSQPAAAPIVSLPVEPVVQPVVSPVVAQPVEPVAQPLVQPIVQPAAQQNQPVIDTGSTAQDLATADKRTLRGSYGPRNIAPAVTSSIPSNPKVGDTWSITITGKAGATISTRTTSPMVSTSDMGTLDTNDDGSGSKTFSGTFSSSDLQNGAPTLWNEIWTVDGVQAGTITFTINPLEVSPAAPLASTLNLPKNSTNAMVDGQSTQTPPPSTVAPTVTIAGSVTSVINNDKEATVTITDNGSTQTMYLAVLPNGDIYGPDGNQVTGLSDEVMQAVRTAFRNAPLTQATPPPPPVTPPPITANPPPGPATPTITTPTAVISGSVASVINNDKEANVVITDTDGTAKTMYLAVLPNGDIYGPDGNQVTGLSDGLMQAIRSAFSNVRVAQTPPLSTTTNAVTNVRIEQIITTANALSYGSLTSDEQAALNTYLTSNTNALSSQNFTSFAPGSVFAWAVGTGTGTALNDAAKSLGFVRYDAQAGVFTRQADVTSGVSEVNVGGPYIDIASKGGSSSLGVFVLMNDSSKYTGDVQVSVSGDSSIKVVFTSRLATQPFGTLGYSVGFITATADPNTTAQNKTADVTVTAGGKSYVVKVTVAPSASATVINLSNVNTVIYDGSVETNIWISQNRPQTLAGLYAGDYKTIAPNSVLANMLGLNTWTNKGETETWGGQYYISDGSVWQLQSAPASDSGGLNLENINTVIYDGTAEMNYQITQLQPQITANFQNYTTVNPGTALAYMLGLGNGSGMSNNQTITASDGLTIYAYKTDTKTFVLSYNPKTTTVLDVDNISSLQYDGSILMDTEMEQLRNPVATKLSSGGYQTITPGSVLAFMLGLGTTGNTGDAKTLGGRAYKFGNGVWQLQTIATPPAAVNNGTSVTLPASTGVSAVTFIFNYDAGTGKINITLADGTTKAFNSLAELQNFVASGNDPSSPNYVYSGVGMGAHYVDNTKNQLWRAAANIIGSRGLDTTGSTLNLILPSDTQVLVSQNSALGQASTASFVSAFSGILAAGPQPKTGTPVSNSGTVISNSNGEIYLVMNDGSLRNITNDQSVNPLSLQQLKTTLQGNGNNVTVENVTNNLLAGPNSQTTVISGVPGQYFVGAYADMAAITAYSNASKPYTATAFTYKDASGSTVTGLTIVTKDILGKDATKIFQNANDIYQFLASNGSNFKNLSPQDQAIYTAVNDARLRTPGIPTYLPTQGYIITPPSSAYVVSAFDPSKISGISPGYLSTVDQADFFAKMFPGSKVVLGSIVDGAVFYNVYPDPTRKEYVVQLSDGTQHYVGNLLDIFQYSGLEGMKGFSGFSADAAQKVLNGTSVVSGAFLSNTPTLTFANLSRPQSGGFAFTDRWQINISNASPNTDVFVDGGIYSRPPVKMLLGKTDANGNFTKTLDRNFTNGEGGIWQINVLVGSRQVGDTLSFEVFNADGSLPLYSGGKQTGYISPGGQTVNTP